MHDGVPSGSGISVSSFNAKTDYERIWQTDVCGFGKYDSSLFEQKRLGTGEIVKLNAGHRRPAFPSNICMVMMSEQLDAAQSGVHGSALGPQNQALEGIGRGFSD